MDQGMKQDGKGIAGSGSVDRETGVAQIRMADGQVFEVPAEVLERYRKPRETVSVDQSADFGDGGVVPILAEELNVSKRTVERGTVRLRKEVFTEEAIVRVPLLSKGYDVVRVPRGEAVEARPEVRQQGATTIYPVVEEEVVTSKRLILREEIHVTEHTEETVGESSVDLHREELVIERSA